MPRPYDEPTIEYVTEMAQRGITDPGLVTRVQPWTDEEKGSFVTKFNELLPAAQKEMDRRERIWLDAYDIRDKTPILRDIPEGIDQGVHGIGALLTRAGGQSEEADTMIREIQESEEAHALADTYDPVPDFLQRGVRGATRSITEMVPGTIAAGPYGAIGMATLTTGNRAITEAKDAGLKGSDFYTYIGTQATLEALFASVFQGLGKGGLESLLGRGITRSGIKGAFRQGGVAMRHEIPEELMTEFSQALNEKFHGVDPTEWSWDQAGRIFVDTMTQTVLATGAISGFSSAVSQEMLKNREEYSENIGQMFGLDKETSLRAMDRASGKKGFEAALGRELLDEQILSTDGLAKWMHQSPENLALAQELSEQKSPSRAQWEKAGLPKRGKAERRRIASELKDLLEVIPEAEAAVETPPEPEVAPPEPEVAPPEPEITPPIEPTTEETVPEPEPVEEPAEPQTGEWGEGSNENHKKQKRALTRAENKGDPTEIIRVAQEGIASFEEKGYPDDWTRWTRAIEDAEYELQNPPLPPPEPEPEPEPEFDVTEASEEDFEKMFEKFGEEAIVEEARSQIPKDFELVEPGGVPMVALEAGLLQEEPSENYQIWTPSGFLVGEGKTAQEALDAARQSGDFGEQIAEPTPPVEVPPAAPPETEITKLPPLAPGETLKPEPAAEEKPPISEKAAQARQDVKDTIGEISDYLDGMALSNPMADPKLWKLTGKLTFQSVKAGYYTFGELIQNVASQIGISRTRLLRPLLERGWEQLRAGDKTGKLSAVENVDHLLEEIKEGQDVDEAGSGEDQDGGEEGPSVRTGDRGDQAEPDAGDVEGAAPEDAEGAEEAGGGEAAGEDTGGEGVRGDVGEPGEDVADGRDEPSGEEVVPSGGGEPGVSGEGAEVSSEPSVEDGEPTAPDVQPNYIIRDPEALVGGSQRQKFERNRKAIETFERVTLDGRTATEEERDALASYIGWGSFGQQLFNGSWERPRPKDGWEASDQWLREHLGEEGWKSAQRSIINAHYTDPPTVTAMWNMLRRMGFKGGRVLEPAMGTGNFFGLMPPDLASLSSLTGIELDEMTGGIAKLLYPQANISIKGYEDSHTPDDFYDLVVGNWPFAAQSPADRRYNKLNPTLHDYFFLKALDQVRPGGLVMGITSSGTMDKAGTKARLEMSKKANLVASYRLPTGAFGKYAGTAVVTDIIVFQKKDPNVQQEIGVPSWVQTSKMDTPAGYEIRVNNYYHENPGNVLGTLNWGHGTTRGAPGMIVDRPSDFENQLTSLPTRIPEGIYTERTIVKPDRYVTSSSDDRINSITVGDDGELYINQGEQMVRMEDRVAYKVASKKKTQARVTQIKSLVKIRQFFGTLLDKQREGADDTEAVRKDLREAHAEFKRKYGPVWSSFALRVFKMVGDPHFAQMASLEVKVSPPNVTPIEYKDATILTRSTTRATPRPEDLSINDAYVFQRNENLSLDVDRIAELAKTTVEEVETELVKNNIAYKSPTGVWTHADEYLSGNVRIKLREARSAREQGIEGMDRNVKALEKVMPEDIPYYKIEAQLGNNWTTPEVYRDFIGDMLGIDPSRVGNQIDLSFGPHGWRVRLSDRMERREEANTNYGVNNVKFGKLLQHAMRFVPIKVTVYDHDLRKRVLDPLATEQANEKIQTIREYFSDWVWKSPERRLDLEKAYNESMNNAVDPKFSGDFLEFEGMMLERGDKPFNLRDHQSSAIARGVILGRGLYGHEVGTGKTYTIGGIAVESRRYGKAKKPLIFAHNANSATVAADINEMYPGAKVLYVGTLNQNNRDIMLAQILSEDWDAIVVPHSLTSKFALRRETYEGLAAEEIADLEAAAIDAANQDNIDLTVDTMNDPDLMKKVRSPTAKELVRARNAIITRINRMSQMASEDAIILEDAGVDMIIVDEAHEFKKPPIATTMKLKGLNKQTSNRSINMMFMLRYVAEARNGEGVHLFTGTPITNTLNEIYNMMRYIMPKEMKNEGLFHWDSWFATFAAEQAEIEVTSAGDYEAISRLSSFINVPELRRMSGQFMDLVFADDMPEFAPRETESGKSLAGVWKLGTRSKAWLFYDLNKEEQEELLNGRTDDPAGRPYKKVNTVVIPMTEDQHTIRVDLQERAMRWRRGSPKDRYDWFRTYAPESPQHILNDAANAGMDARLFSQDLPDDPGSKVNVAIDNVMEHYKEHPKATQAIFMDRGTGDESIRTERSATGEKIQRRVSRLNLAKDIMNKLIDRGIPPKEIALMVGGLTKEKKKEVEAAVFRGEIRVVIGGTQTLGTGVNIQENLRAMHHIDAPWRPGDLEQRNGRGQRQGNKWNTVLEYRYVTEGIDGRRWQALVIKDRFILEFLRSKGDARVIESEALDLDDSQPNDMVATLSDAVGDPRILLIAKAKKDLERLMRREHLFTQGLAETVQRLKEMRISKERDFDRWISFREEMQKQLDDTKDDKFSIEINGKEYDNRKDAEIALRSMLPRLTSESQEIGSFRGLELRGFMRFSQYGGAQPRIVVLLPGETDRRVLESSASVQGVEAILRNNQKNLDKLRTELEDHVGTVKRLESSLSEPFPQQQALANTRNRLQQLETELQLNPVPPPAWLRQPTPIGTAVHFDGRERIVAGHQWNDIGYFVQLEAPRGETELASYDEIYDEHGTRIYEDRAFKAPDLTNRPETEPEITEDEGFVDESEQFNQGEQLGMVRSPEWPPRPAYLPQRNEKPESERERTPGEKRPRKKKRGLIQTTDIMQAIKKMWPELTVLGKATHYMSRRYAGWYKGFLGLMRLKNPRDFDRALHELGHHFDRQLKGWSKSKGLPRGIPTELIKLGKELYGDTAPAGGYRAEGFSDFIRYFIAQNTDIQEKAPKLYDWFTTEFLVENPKERDKLQKLSDLVAQRVSQTSDENLEAFMKKNKQDWSPKRTVAKLERQHIDKALPILRAMQKAGIDVNSLDPDVNPYMMAVAYARTGGGRAAFASLQNTVDLDGNITGIGLSEALKPVSIKGQGEVKNWKKYAVASRAKHLMEERGLESGVAYQDAVNVFNKYDSQEFRDVTQAVTDWSHRMLHLLVESGLMTQKEFNTIVRDNPVYLPFMRQFMEGEKKKGLRREGGKGVYRYKGDSREIKDPLDMLVVQAESIWKAALEADVARALVNLSTAAKTEEGTEPLGDALGKMLVEVPAPREAKTFTAEQIKRDIANIAVKRLGADPDEVGAAMLDVWEERMTVFSRGTEYKGSDNIFGIVINGKRRFFEIRDEGLQIALGAVSKDRFLPGKAGEISRQIVGLQRLGATGLNPAFGLIRNLIRDSFTAMITADYHFHTPIVSTLYGAIKAARKTESARLYEALGLNFTSRIQQDKYTSSSPGRQVTAASPWGKIWHGGMVSGLRDLMSYSEIGPRLLEFEGAMRYGEKKKFSKKGKHILAGVAAKDVTVNFSRSGSAGAQINEIVLFYNAGVQGLNKLGRSLGVLEPMPWQRYKTRKANLAKTASAGAMLTMAALYFFLKNREKREWEELPPYEKWNYLYIDWSDKGNPIRIPLPFEAGALFGSLPVALLDGKKSFKEALQEAGHNAMSVNLGGETFEDWAHAIFRNIAAIAPVMDVVANRDWKEDYIFNPYAAKRTVREEQYTPYTTELAKMIGKHFPGHFLTPAQIDHLLTGYTGGLYRRLASAVSPTTYTKMAEGGDLSTIPVAGTLFVRPGRSRLLNDFYDRMEDIAQKKGSGKASLEEIGWYSEGESMRRDQKDLWQASRDTEDREERVRIREQIHEQIRQHDKRTDFDKIGSYSVILSATADKATKKQKETARNLLQGHANLYNLLRKAAKYRGWSIDPTTSTMKLTSFGKRLREVKKLKTNNP